MSAGPAVLPAPGQPCPAAVLAAVLIVAAAVAVISRPDPDPEDPMSMSDNTDPFLGAPGDDAHDVDITDRPRPVRDAATDSAKVIGLLSALLTAGVGFGLLTAVQADALTGLLGLIPGVVAGALTAWSALRTADRSEPQVTPNSDPRKVVRDRDGRRVRLVRLVPER